MCSLVICNQCKKPTWSGCGEHIEQALDGVAKEDRCQGHENDSVTGGFLKKIFGKNK
jgi:hypothetical protein